MSVWRALLSISLLLGGCAGTEGAEAAKVCTQVTCPVGTAAILTAEAQTACSGGVSATRGWTEVGASASAACIGEGACTLICEPVNECCGGEAWTEDSYTCETPCGDNACVTVSCPVGTAPMITAESETNCEEGALPEGASASAACIGKDACAIVCEPVSECCGGEVWTEDSYACETPCGANTCTQVTCPVGTAPVLTAGSATSCVDGALPDGASERAACIGVDECAIACEPVSACCGGEQWTEDSYICETPCAGACACDGKCGTVTGVDCQAECGGCEGGQICSPDNLCVDACEGEVVSCGGACCGTGEVCHQNLCCDPVANCAGRACGDDGCGGLCEYQPSIDGCDEGETCDQTGQCVTACACEGKCGTVTGVDCEAECGGCEGGQVCSPDNLCVDACEGEVETCGGACCGTGEVCFQAECCDPVANCAGKACGDDGCGGVCEGLDSIDGCPANEVCTQSGQCATSCAGELPRCIELEGDALVETCELVDDVYMWVESQNCSAGQQVCADGPNGGVCAECALDAHCLDDDPCTSNEACTEVFECVSEPTPCDDGLACNGTETCDAAQGGCQAGTPLECVDDNPCTDDTCDDTLGCQHPNNSAPCDDADACTDNDLCAEGVCAGTSVDPDDGFSCTLDDCDAASGVSNTPDHTLCDDSDPCTEALCDPSADGAVAGSGCVTEWTTNPCEDGLSCTYGDTCQDGTCMAVAQKSYNLTLIDATSDQANGPIVSTADDGVVFTTQGSDNGAGGEGFTIQRRDAMGALVWSTAFSEYAGAEVSDMAVLPGDAGYVVVGQAQVVLDDNEYEWTVPSGFAVHVSADGAIVKTWSVAGLCTIDEMDECPLQSLTFEVQGGTEPPETRFEGVAVSPEGQIMIVGAVVDSEADDVSAEFVGLMLWLDTAFALQAASELTQCQMGVDGPGALLHGVRYLGPDALDQSGAGWFVTGSANYGVKNCNKVYCYEGLGVRMSTSGAILACQTFSYTLHGQGGATADYLTIEDVVEVEAEGDYGPGYVLLGHGDGYGDALVWYGWAARVDIGLAPHWSKLYGPTTTFYPGAPDMVAEENLFSPNHQFNDGARVAGVEGVYLGGSVRHAEPTSVDGWVVRIDAAGGILDEKAFGGAEEAHNGRLTGLSNGVALHTSLLDNFTYQTYGVSVVRTDVEGMMCSE